MMNVKSFNHLPDEIKLPLLKFKTTVKKGLINNPFYSIREYFKLVIVL